MDTTTITMERRAAVTKLEQYERAAQANPQKVQELDHGIMQGYRVLARGGRLVDVNDAIRAGGLNLAGQPKLAISRANVQWSEFRGDHLGGGRFAWHERPWWDDRYYGSRFSWAVPNGTFKPLSDKAVRAMTPLIPLPLRPKAKLENYFLLWEANWHPAPPRDPYLLRPLAGSLMEIIAEWDVTDLELAAVRSAMRTGR